MVQASTSTGRLGPANIKVGGRAYEVQSEMPIIHLIMFKPCGLDEHEIRKTIRYSTYKIPGELVRLQLAILPHSSLHLFRSQWQ